MIGSYEVGAIFRIVNDASPTLEKIALQLKELDKLLATTQKRFTALGASFKLESIQSLERINKALGLVAESATVAGDKVGSAFEKVGVIGQTSSEKLAASYKGAFAEISAGARLAAAEVGGINAVARNTMRLPGAGGRNGSGSGGGGSGGGHSGGGHGGLHVWGGPGAHVGGASIHAGQDSDGFWEVVGGMAVLEGVKKTIEASMELQNLQIKAKAAGYTSQQQAEISAAAWKNAGKFVNTTAAESYRNILDITQATGSYAEAIRLLPAMTKVDIAIAGIKDEGAKSALHSQSIDVARSLDILAVTQDENKMNSVIDAFKREFVGMTGRLTPQMMFQGLQNAGSARYTWDEEFIGKYLGPLLYATKGRAGAALYQLDRSFGSGVMTESMAQAAEKYGLYSKDDEVRDANGNFKGMKANSVAGDAIRRANPVRWALETVIPLLKAHGVNVDDVNSLSMVLKEIGRSNKNLQVILDELLLPGSRGQLDKERANIEKVPSDASDELSESLNQKINGLHKKWNDLLTAIGGPMIDKATFGVTKLTNAINSLAQFAESHPNLTRAAVDLTGIAAGLVTLGGAVKMLKFALSGLSIFEWLFGGKGGSTPGLPGEPHGLGVNLPKGDAPFDPWMGLGGKIPEVPKAINIKGLIGNGLKGGIIGAGVEIAGEWLLNDLLPISGKAADFENMGVIGHIMDLIKTIRGTSGAVPPAADSDFIKRHTPAAPAAKPFEGMPALDGMPGGVSSLKNSVLTGAKDGLTQGAAQAEPAVKSAMTGGTSGGVVAGLQAASGSARAIVASWFAGAAAGVLAGAKPGGVVPPAGVASHTRTAAVHLDGVKVGMLVESSIVRSHQFPRSTNGFDGGASYAPVDVVAV